MKSSELFSPEPINTGRQNELDCVKAFAIIGMILTRGYGPILTGTDILTNIVSYNEYILGAFLFMICMGIGMHYSRHQKPMDYMKRGISLATVGLLLNLLDGFIPSTLLYLITGKQWYAAQTILLLGNDILQFASLAFFAMAIIKKFKFKTFYVLLFSFAMNIAGYVLAIKGPEINNYFLCQFLGNFYVTAAESYFTLSSYFVFVVFGYWIGEKYPYIKDKDRLSTKILLIFTPICLIWYSIRLTVSIPLMPDFHSQIQYITLPGPDAIFSCIMGLWDIALWYKITKLFSKGVPAIFKHLSVNITKYFCTSNFIFLWMDYAMIYFGIPRTDSSLLATFIILIVICICYFVIEWYRKHWEPKLKSMSEKKKYLCFAGIWVVSIIGIALMYPHIIEPANLWNDYLYDMIR